MDAIELLEEQHRNIERLFGKPGSFRELVELLTTHMQLEEEHFYPWVRTDETEELIEASYEEHLAMKRLLADLIKLGPDDEQREARLVVLEELVGEHIDAERDQLFPLVRRRFDGEQLEAMAQVMVPARMPPEVDEPLRSLDRMMSPVAALMKAVRNFMDDFRRMWRRPREA